VYELKLDSDGPHAPTYSGRSFSHGVPKYRLAAEGIDADAAYQLVHDGSTFPIVALRATDPEVTDLTTVSHLLREHGWIVPAYTLPANAQQTSVLRIVVKENFSRDMVDMLARDLGVALEALKKQTTAYPHRPRRRPHC
jgi:glutamate decarboxylase